MLLKIALKNETIKPNQYIICRKTNISTKKDDSLSDLPFGYVFIHLKIWSLAVGLRPCTIQLVIFLKGYL